MSHILNFKLKSWLAENVSMVDRQGYRVTPVYSSGKTQPFGCGQTYPDPSDACWDYAVSIGVVLDDAMLLDYDGNKASLESPIISLENLAQKLELSSMPRAVQRNDLGDSLHFLFSCPEYLCTNKYKQSNDGGWLQHVDIKWGNQLVILKPHKIIVCSELPSKASLEPAPKPLVDALYKSDFKNLNRTVSQTTWDGNLHEVEEARAILRFIDPEDGYEDWLDVLMRISDKFGASEAAVELADEWSQRGGNYCSREEIEYKLNSFTTRDGYDRPKKSWGALCARARDNGADLAAIREIYTEFSSEGTK